MNIISNTNSNMSKTGYLDLFIGSMFSGKTSKLIEIYKQCKFCNNEIIVINYAGDTRYSDTMLSTHDKTMIPCIKSTTIQEVLDKHPDSIKSCDVIIINEGQFFSDIELVRELVDKHNKRIYICGLDGDFERKPIGNLLNLIPYCDNVCKMHSLCSICKDGTAGIFTFRLSNETEQVVIGSDNYIPVCRNCFTNLSKKKI